MRQLAGWWRGLRCARSRALHLGAQRDDYVEQVLVGDLGHRSEIEHLEGCLPKTGSGP